MNNQLCGETFRDFKCTKDFKHSGDHYDEVRICWWEAKIDSKVYWPHRDYHEKLSKTDIAVAVFICLVTTSVIIALAYSLLTLQLK